MARISVKVLNYTPKGRGHCTTTMSTFDTIQEVLNTMFDIRTATQKKWGYTWYEYARYGYYAEARKELVTKPACTAKTVALQCIADLEFLRGELDRLDKGDRR